MRMHAGKKIGQSGNELTLAVFFSFFLHAAAIALALFLYMAVTPKIKIPPYYQVKLVGLPAESQPVPAQEPAQPAPKKPEPGKKALPKPVKAAPAKSAVPEFSAQKPKHEKPESAPTEQETAPSAPTAKAGGKSEGVAVSAGSEDFKFPFYLALVRNQIERNWNPPPVAKGTKAKVEFTILRSGRVFGDARLEESSGNTFFDMAAKRAILLSSPFPPMPEDFYKDQAVFSVDLVEQP